MHQCSLSQNEELEKDANSMDSRILGFGAVSLNKSFPTFRILLGPSETELNAIPSLKKGENHHLKTRRRIPKDLSVQR